MLINYPIVNSAKVQITMILSNEKLFKLVINLVIVLYKKIFLNIL